MGIAAAQRYGLPTYVPGSREYEVTAKDDS